jgi:hypothetical protein
LSLFCLSKDELGRGWMWHTNQYVPTKHIAASAARFVVPVSAERLCNAKLLDADAHPLRESITARLVYVDSSSWHFWYRRLWRGIPEAEAAYMKGSAAATDARLLRMVSICLRRISAASTFASLPGSPFACEYEWHLGWSVNSPICKAVGAPSSR